jgi:Pyrimidine dimer DNA glycosylase
MQTFLPYIGEYDNATAIYEESAFLLSPKHVGEQRVINLIFMINLVDLRGWEHGPEIEMWRGYEWSLLQYQEAICEEWVHQLGHEDPYYDITHDLYFSNPSIGEQYEEPPWLEREGIRLAYQSNLIRIDPAYYRKKFPGVPDSLPYIYP